MPVAETQNTCRSEILFSLEDSKNYILLKIYVASSDTLIIHRYFNNNNMQ